MNCLRKAKGSVPMLTRKPAVMASCEETSDAPDPASLTVEASNSCVASSTVVQTGGSGPGAAPKEFTVTTLSHFMASLGWCVTKASTAKGPDEGAAAGTVHLPISLGKPYTSRPTTTASPESTKRRMGSQRGSTVVC